MIEQIEITEIKPLIADASVIRAALLDVTDSGWKCSSGCDIGHLWRFDPDDESDDQTEHRMRFADAVESRIRELASAGCGIKLENYCTRHLGMRLPHPTASVCADCEGERTAQ